MAACPTVAASLVVMPQVTSEASGAFVLVAKEDLKRRASRNLKCDRNLFDGDDDTEAAAAAAGSGKRKFAAETWSERALNASWMCGVCGCLLLWLCLLPGR